MTSRSESRSRDGQKIDLINQDEFSNGRLPGNFQCKTTSTSLPYGKILAEMPEGKELNIIAHNQTRKVGQRFISIGHYAIMTLDDFLNLFKHALETGYEPNTTR